MGVNHISEKMGAPVAHGNFQGLEDLLKDGRLSRLLAFWVVVGGQEQEPGKFCGVGCGGNLIIRGGMEKPSDGIVFQQHKFRRPRISGLAAATLHWLFSFVFETF